jgi:hypothetical protein
MPVVRENDYYSLHGIWGASATLALGRIGKGAGMVVGDVQPPHRAMFVGYREGSGRPVLLPFAPDVKVGLGTEAYQAEPPEGAPEKPPFLPDFIPFSCFSGAEMIRSVSLSGERWEAGRVSLEITSFFGSIPDPARANRTELRSGMRPAIYATISFDNTDGKEILTGVFGMQGIRRPLSDASGGKMLGFAQVNSWGFATEPADDVDEVMNWISLFASMSGKKEYLRRLAAEGCLRFSVPAGEKRSYCIALGVFRDGIVTAGLKTRAFHTSLFRDLDDVLADALAGKEKAFEAARALDAEFDASDMSPERKILLANAVHSYNASTELLITETGEPVFVVNEGEYQMMNTLDLTVDQVFHELKFSPWTVANELDFLYSRSSYNDAYGLAFTHDQGVGDCFTPQGISSYELPRLSGCFSQMTYEETLNWILTACLYAHNADNGSWLARNRDVLTQSVESILARDGNGDGLMDLDSDRCDGGSEITTYDSLDASLGQTRNNLYIAIKAWGTLVSFAAVFDRHLVNPTVPETELAKIARESATAIMNTVISRVKEPDGYIPAVFEGGNDSKIIPAVEGLVYPLFCGDPEAVSRTGPYAKLIAVLGRHLDAVLVPGVCLDAESGGWKLSSTSRNTWMSKIFINQYVAEHVFGLSDERITRDAVHLGWQCNGSADWGPTDQVASTNGKDLGSRLYPRLVSAILWLYPPEKQ